MKNNNSYYPTIDTPISGITVQLNDYYFGNPVQPVTTDDQGHYIFRNLYPSKYNISAVEGDYTLLNRQAINIEPGNNTYNVSKPKLAGVKGVVYQDSNGDKKYNAGEEESTVHIKLTYTKLNDVQLTVANVTTGASGSYAFPSLIPGEYTLNATKFNTSTGYLDFLTEQSVTLTANKTSWVNISLTYAPVAVDGYTKYETTAVAGIPITFAPDKSVTNNTATKQSTATSNAQGSFGVALIPGTYNVTVKKTEGATTVYTFTGKLILFIGDGTASYNLSLTKVSVTVSGSTTYNGSGKANMTIFFTKDLNIKNNTAITTSVKTKANGIYSIELTPGSYNVTVEETVNESGQNVTYFSNGLITVSSGEAPRVFSLILAREQSA